MKRGEKSRSVKKSPLIHGFEKDEKPSYKKKREIEENRKKLLNKVVKVAKEMGYEVLSYK